MDVENLTIVTYGYNEEIVDDFCSYLLEKYEELKDELKGDLEDEEDGSTYVPDSVTSEDKEGKTLYGVVYSVSGGTFYEPSFWEDEIEEFIKLRHLSKNDLQFVIEISDGENAEYVNTDKEGYFFNTRKKVEFFLYPTEDGTYLTYEEAYDEFLGLLRYEDFELMYSVKGDKKRYYAKEFFEKVKDLYRELGAEFPKDICVSETISEDEFNDFMANMDDRIICEVFDYEEE